MALPATEKPDGGRAIVIEGVPSGTGITDLIHAFSPFGTIHFASVGPPAVVAFQTEASAAQALLVASMKSVSLLGTFREKKLLMPAPAPAQPASRNHPSPSTALAPPLGASPETEISSNEATAAPPAKAAAPKTKTSKKEARKVLLDRLEDALRLLKDKFSQLESDLHLHSQIYDRVEEEGRGQMQNGSNPVGRGAHAG